MRLRFPILMLTIMLAIATAITVATSPADENVATANTAVQSEATIVATCITDMPTTEMTAITAEETTALTTALATDTAITEEMTAETTVRLATSEEAYVTDRTTTLAANTLGNSFAQTTAQYSTARGHQRTPEVVLAIDEAGARVAQLIA